MYNAGFDIGDIGAGITDDVIDLTDVGIKKDIKDTNLNDLKVGDLIGFDGHIAMIIGIKNNDVYIAQMYWVGDLQVLQCDFNETYLKLKNVVEEDNIRESNNQYEFIKTSAIIGTALIVILVIIVTIIVVEEYIHG